MFLKKYYDLVINTCYEEPTKYKETTPHYLNPSKINEPSYSGLLLNIFKEFNIGDLIPEIK